MGARARVRLGFDLVLIDLRDCPTCTTCRGTEVSRRELLRALQHERDLRPSKFSLSVLKKQHLECKAGSCGPHMALDWLHACVSSEKLQNRNEVHVEDASPPGKVPPVHTPTDLVQ